MEAIPVLAMLTATVEGIVQRAGAVAAELARHGVVASVERTEATVGGGAYPASRIPSAAVALAGGSATGMASRLRAARTPIVGRIRDDRLLLDLRSVPPSTDAAVAVLVVEALA